LENIRHINNQQEDVEIILEKINFNSGEINFNTIDKSSQSNSKFYVRKNAYIYKLLDEGDYLISINLKNESTKNNDYNLRIGGQNKYLETISSDKFRNLSNYYKNNYSDNNHILNIDINMKSHYILLEKTYYDLKVYSIANFIYKTFYNPYENDLEIKVENGLKNIISTITDAYNNHLYEIQKFYENDKNIINLLFKDVKEKLRKDDYNLIMQDELEILKLVEDLKEQAKNVKVIFHAYINTTENISLLELKNIIIGSEMNKHIFY
jgi:hypothetical protein